MAASAIREFKIDDIDLSDIENMTKDELLDIKIKLEEKTTEIVKAIIQDGWNYNRYMLPSNKSEYQLLIFCNHDGLEKILYRNLDPHNYRYFVLLDEIRKKLLPKSSATPPPESAGLVPCTIS